MGTKKWQKLKPFTIDWKDRQGRHQQSSSLRFDWLVDHLRKHRKLRHDDLGLPTPERTRRNWMDADETYWGHYAPTSNGGTPNTATRTLKMALGQHFPVAPGIDREGFATSSPQLHLQRGLLLARARVLQEAPLLVPQRIDREKNEHVQFRFGGNPPLAALMEFFNLCVSIVDITLIQAYYAGYYAPEESGLTFSEHAMGPATGRRVWDKLKWVRLLSGNDLNAPKEMKAFKQLKGIRNHLAHFDPPCFSVTVEDLAGWLSKVPDLAWLLIKIRQCLGLPVSGHIIQMALCPSIVAVPRDPKTTRHPQRSDVGYLSSTWQGNHPHSGSNPLRAPVSAIGPLVRLQRRLEKQLKRTIHVSEVLDAVIMQRLSQLDGMDNAGMLKQLRSALTT